MSISYYLCEPCREPELERSLFNAIELAGFAYPLPRQILAEAEAQRVAYAIDIRYMGCLDSPLAGDLELLCEAAETTPSECGDCGWVGKYSELKNMPRIPDGCDFVVDFLWCPVCFSTALMVGDECEVSA